MPSLGHTEEEPTLQDILKENVQSEGLDHAEQLEATFKAVQDKFDVMEHLERHGDINDPAYLRSELQRNSFMLAHEKVTNTRREKKLSQLQKHVTSL